MPAFSSNLLALIPIHAGGAIEAIATRPDQTDEDYRARAAAACRLIAAMAPETEAEIPLLGQIALFHFMTVESARASFAAVAMPDAHKHRQQAVAMGRMFYSLTRDLHRQREDRPRREEMPEEAAAPPAEAAAAPAVTARAEAVAMPAMAARPEAPAEPEAGGGTAGPAEGRDGPRQASNGAPAFAFAKPHAEEAARGLSASSVSAPAMTSAPASALTGGTGSRLPNGSAPTRPAGPMAPPWTNNAVAGQPSGTTTGLGGGQRAASGPAMR